jgi:ATP-binding cassette subfamily B protein
MFDLWGPDRYERTPAFPRLVAESLRVAWQAGRRELTVMVVLQVASIVGVVAAALVGRAVLSDLLHAERVNGGLNSLVPEVLVLTALTAALGAAHAVQLHRQRILAELCQRHGEEQVLAVTGSVELAAFDEPGFHDAVARALLAVRLLPSVVGNLSGLLRALAVALGAIVALAALEPAFAPVVVLVVVPSMLAARRSGRAFHRFARSVTPQDRERRYLADLLSDRDAAKEVRAYDLFRFLHGRHDRLWEERVTRFRGVADRQLRFTLAADVAASLLVCGTLLALIALTLSHDISLAGATVTAGAIILLGQRLAVAGMSAGGLSESALFLGDYLDLVRAAPQRPVEAAPAGDPPRPLRVRAEHVTFAYPGTRGPALRDVSLEIAPGEVVALVGENGSGKTTLAKLLAGLYVPQQGRVTWNDVDTASADRDARRRGVAIIFQDFLRYSLPARENIAVGRHEDFDDDDALRRAARVAGAHDDLERLPQGYDTMLGPAFAGGTDLSMGQWQRVALARAVFRDAPFVILDEPTAALDAQAEHDLFARIRELLASRSVLLISHRFSSVREADRIYVMRAGAIIETGSHDDLMGDGGRYAELFTLQAAPYR